MPYLNNFIAGAFLPSSPNELPHLLAKKLLPVVVDVADPPPIAKEVVGLILEVLTSKRLDSPHRSM